MKSIKKTLLYGLFVWLIPFATAFLIYPIHESNRILFESIMPVAVTISCMLFTTIYFKKIDTGFLKEGILLGTIWLILNIVIDLFMFMQVPMKMTLPNYIADIGITYLIIPSITIGCGYLMNKKQK